MARVSMVLNIVFKNSFGIPFPEYCKLRWHPFQLSTGFTGAYSDQCSKVGQGHWTHRGQGGQLTPPPYQFLTKLNQINLFH